MDPVYCTQMNLAIYLDSHLERTPNAKYLFTEDMDDGAPKRLKQNVRNNLNRHVLKNEQFMDLFDEDEDQGIGLHSWRKGAADEARKNGALADEIEIRGRWKQQGRRVVFRYIDVQQLHIDAKVAGVLCKGGPIKYKLKAVLQDQITDDWLFEHCVPHIRQRFSNDRRFCKVLGLAMLYAYCDPSLRESLTEQQRARIQAGLQGVQYEDNCVEKIPLHIYSVNGNLCIDEVTGALPTVGGAATAVATAVNTGSHHAVLSSILLQQQRCAQSVSLLHMHVDNQFQAMKTFLQRQNTTLNGNIRRFGGTIQGGFARQDPVQAGDRRVAAAQLGNPPNDPQEDGTAELVPNIRNLAELWDEWKFGIGGRKPAQFFTQQERGGYGNNGKKQRYYRRLKIWLLQQKLVNEGHPIGVANLAIREAYGRNLSLTNLSKMIQRLPDHPNIWILLPGQAPRLPAVPPAPRGRGRGRGRGARVAALPTQRRLAPMFRAPGVPRLPDTQLGLQAELNRRLRGDGPGGPDHVMFQNPTIRAEI